MNINDVIVTHTITNLQQFQTVVQRATDMLRKAGVTNATINRNLADPNQVIAVLECNDVTKYRQWIQTPEYRTVLQNAGATTSQYIFVEQLLTMPIINGINQGGAIA
jgi:uncharacterized protein (DUF1330 family)